MSNNDSFSEAIPCASSRGVVVLAGCAGASLGDPISADATPNSGSDITAANGSLEVHYINVGQSVSTLVIEPDGETMLVDTGHYNDDGKYVLEYLRRHDITRIDHLVSSHNDADHIGGNAAIIDYYETEAGGIGAVYDPGLAASTLTYGEYLDAVEAHEVTLYETREGDSVSFGKTTVDVLGPRSRISRTKLATRTVSFSNSRTARRVSCCPVTPRTTKRRISSTRTVRGSSRRC